MRTVPRRPSPLPSAAQCLLTGVLLSWILGFRRGIGRPGEWEWKLSELRPDGVLLAAAVAMLGVVVLLCALGAHRQLTADTPREQRRLAAMWQALLVGGVFAWTVMLYSATPGGWATLTAAAMSDIANEYLGDAYAIADPLDYAADYPAKQEASLRRSVGRHVATHPPGAVLVYWAGIRLAVASGLTQAARPVAEAMCGTDARSLLRAVSSVPAVRPVAEGDIALPIIAALALALLGALAVVPMAAVGRHILGPEGAFPSAVLTATIPAFGLCFQTLDALLALMFAAALLMSLRCAASGHALWALGAGMVLGLASFVSFGAVAGLLMCASVVTVGSLPTDRPVLHAWRPKRGSPRPPLWRAVGLSAAVLAGAAVVWAGLVVSLRFDLPSIIATAERAHRMTSEGFGRAYHTWVWMNLVEFGAFLGPALAVATVVGAVAALRRGGLARALAVGALGTLLLLNLSGTVRGEVGRVWLPLMPPLAAIAACAGSQVEPEPGPPRVSAWLPTLVLQVAALVAMCAALHPSVRPY